MGALDAESIVTFADVGAWEAWLADNHTSPAGVWLRIAKKGSGNTTVTVGDALDVALCFGWIDGQRRSLDESYFLQRYSPRRPRSTWSQVNVAKVASLGKTDRYNVILRVVKATTPERRTARIQEEIARLER